MKRRVIFAIVRKDVRDAIVTFRILGILLMPLMMTGLYGFIIGDSLATFRVVIFDPTGSVLTKVLDATPNIEAIHALDAVDVELMTDERAAHVGLVLPPNFDAALQAEENPPVTLFINRTQLGADGVAQIVLTTIQLLTPQSLGVDLTRQSINESPEDAGLLNSILGLKNTFAILSIVLVLATLGVFMVPVSIIEEKERRTIDALLVAPVSYVELTIAKAIGGLFYALVASIVVMLVNQSFVDTNLLVLALVLGLGALASVMLGLFLGSLFESMQSLNVWATFAMIPFLGPIVLSFVPSSSTVQNLLQILPTYHLLQGLLLAMNPAADLKPLGGHLLVLLLTTAIFSVSVLWLLRRREV